MRSRRPIARSPATGPIPSSSHRICRINWTARLRQRRKWRRLISRAPKSSWLNLSCLPCIILFQIFMPRRVSLFVTCMVDQLFPKIGLALVDVLENLGFAVDFPEAQTCCGQPAFNSGYRDEARAVARHFLDVFEASEAIVVPSGSCASMLAHHFEELFPDDPGMRARAEKLARRVWEFSAFLTEVAGIEDVGARLEDVVTFHDGCHALRELGIQSAPRRLLANVRGLELREMEPREECCGFGGTFSVKFGELSGAMARGKIEAIVRTGAKTVVSLDPSCLMQIQGALSRAGIGIRTMHLAEVLASR